MDLTLRLKYRQRLRDIAIDVGAVLQDDMSPMEPPRQRAPFCVPEDDARANSMLQQTRAEATSTQKHPSTFRRAFSGGQKADTPYTQREILDALARVVHENGSSGVVEVLLTRSDKLAIVNKSSRRASAVFVKKVKHVDNQDERGQLLRFATELSRPDLVRLLAPHADIGALDDSLDMALKLNNIDVIKLLIAYGANASLYQSAFRESATNGDCEMLTLMLRSSKPVSSHCVTENLLVVVKSNSLRATLLLVHAGADVEYDFASSLMYAVQSGKVDLTVALLLGSNPPSPKSLNRALDLVFTNSAYTLRDKHTLVEILLCCGPDGNAKSEGLFIATCLMDQEMMQLLLEHGADVNYKEACAIGHAIQRSRSDLVSLLLQNQNLLPPLAAELIMRIPRTSAPSFKVSILSMLLLQGAKGIHCDEQLIVAAETDDNDTAQLLVSFGKDRECSPVVSADHGLAIALQTAVSRNNVDLVRILVSECRFPKSSLSKAVSLVSRHPEEDHFILVEILLQGGAEGPEVDAAVQEAAIGPLQSPQLVDLFVRNGVRVAGQTLFPVVMSGNISILKILLPGNLSSITCAAAITVAMKRHTRATRYTIIKLLLPYAISAGFDNADVSQALVDGLLDSADDLPLLKLLCSEGKANTNFQNGKAICLAVKVKIPEVLDVILDSANSPPTTSALSRALESLMDLEPDDGSRVRKLRAILRKGRPQETINRALVKEVQNAVIARRDLSLIRVLLEFGADVNFSGGAPVCHSVRDSAVVQLLLTRNPSSNTLSNALPLAVALPTSERYTVCEDLLQAGATEPGISEALCVLINEGPAALDLVQLLIPKADINLMDGKALKEAVKRSFHAAVASFLSHRSGALSMATVVGAFEEAMLVRDPSERLKLVRTLPIAEMSGEILSRSLIATTNLQDLDLVKLLLEFGASVDYQGGQAVLAAASSGCTEILRTLVGGNFARKPNLSTLTTGFGGASSLYEEKKDLYYLIIQILLEAGLNGEVIDAALVESVREGDENIRLTRLIYEHGASIAWHEGEVLEVAVRSASISTLNLLLQRRPRQTLLKRAYKSTLTIPREQRLQIINEILKAGKTIDKHVINTLFRAARETPADRQLIQLLLDHHVFDEGESMAHAAEILDVDTVALLVQSPEGKPYLSVVFGDVIGTRSPWSSNEGLAIAELLLSNGAAGGTIDDALITAVEKYGNGGNSRANSFLDTLLKSGADVNHRRGISLQLAAKTANLELIQKLIPSATTDSKAMAMSYLFQIPSEETLAISMVNAFMDTINSQEQLDASFIHPDGELAPVLFMVLKQFPRKARVLKFLLESGFNPNQWQDYELDSNFGKEECSLLCWAIAQPQKFISSANLELLIDSGASVNFRSRSGTDIVMLCIREQRVEILERIIAKGAKVTNPNGDGVAPLAFASLTGNPLIMSSLLRAGAEINDGSLHDASRELRCEAMRVLIRFNHEVDFPSDRHDGRSALAELCFRASDNENSLLLEEAIECLIANGADVRLRFKGGLTLFHYALDSSNPITILRVLLKVLWKIVNEDVFLFDDGRYTYSLTSYVRKGLSSCPDIQRQDIIELLHQKRAMDRFWANDLDMPQPTDLCGAPQHVMDEVHRQKAQERRFAEQRRENLSQIELKRIAAIEDGRIQRELTQQGIRLELEKARARDGIIERQAINQRRLESEAELERQRLAGIRHASESAHLKAIGDAQIHTQRRIGEVKIENVQTENLLAIEFLQTKTKKENEGMQSRLAIESVGREDAERVQIRMHEREMARLRSQKQITDSNTALAANLRSGGMNQRQIGYITGEVS